MGFYRVSRNLEASLIDFLKERLVAENWNNIAVEKSFSKIYSLQMDENKNSASICVRASATNRERVEIGSNAMLRKELIIIDVFSTSDGQRLDLVDFLGDELKCGFPYFEYKTEKNIISARNRNGRVTILNIEDAPVNFGVDKSTLDAQDRYRHTITLTVSLGKAEV